MAGISDNEPPYGRVPGSVGPEGTKNFEDLTLEEKIQVLAERVAYSYLSGMNGKISYSDTLSPHVKNQEMVYKAKRLAGWLEVNPNSVGEKKLKALDELSVYNNKPGSYFAPLFKDVKSNPDNPYLKVNAANARHDAELLDQLIKDKYLVDAKLEEADIPSLREKTPQVGRPSEN